MFSRNNDLKKLATPKALTVPPLGGIDQYTKLILHGEDVTDSSLYCKSITNDGVTSSATQSKFGGKSINVPTTSAYLRIPTDADFNMGTGDFTLEGWMYFTSASTYKTLIGLGIKGAGELLLRTDNTSNNKMVVVVNGAGILTESTTSVINTWYHYELSKISGTYTLRKNGVSVGSVANATAINPSTNPYVYVAGATDGAYSAVGYIDEVRIIKGLGAHSADFTPPDRPYTVLN